MASSIATDITLFPDARESKVWVGDTIAYAVREYNSSALRIGIVTRIQNVEPEYGRPYIRVQVEVDGRKRWIENTFNVVKLVS